MFIARKVKMVLTGIIVASLLLMSSTFAEDINQKMDLEALNVKYIQESPDIKLIDIKRNLMDVQYEGKIKDYQDSKKSLKNSEDVLINMENYRALVKQQFASASSGDDHGAMASSLAAAVANYNVRKQEYKQKVKGFITQMQTIEPVLLQKKQSDRVRENEITKAKASLQTDYYNLLILNKQEELLKKDLEILNKQIETEKLKSNYGMTTNLNIDDLERQQRQLSLSIKQNENSIDLEVQSLKTKLNMKIDDKLDIDYKVPLVNSVQSYSLQDALTIFNERNIDLESAKNNLDINKEALVKLNRAYEHVDENGNVTPTGDEYEIKELKTSELQISQTELNLQNLQRSMELYVKKVYYKYNEAAINALSGIENRKLYLDKKNTVEANFKQGMISKLQYDSQIHELDKQLFEVDKVMINYVNANTQMEMIAQGIYIQ